MSIHSNNIDLSNIEEPFQSEFKCDHSTETALVTVPDLLHYVADWSQASIVRLFNLLAAFDTRDHNIFLQKLHYFIDLLGAVRGWFHTFLSDQI